MVPEIEVISRLILSSLLGGLIGLEREVHGRPAGFRTHLLVSLGACLFVVTSVYFYQKFGNFSGQGSLGADPARIAAQVVTGIGFLGAGAIIREKATIRGLTTAACLWVAAAVGVAVGVGMYYAAVFVAILAVINLIFLKKLEDRLNKDTYFKVTVWSIDTAGKINQVEEALSACSIEIVNMTIEKDIVERSILFEVDAKGRAHGDRSRVTDILASLDGIKKVRLE